MGKVLMYILIAASALGALRLFSAPLKLGLKFLGNTLIGLLLLVVFNAFGEAVGVTIGLNLFTTAIVAIFGPFGIVLLLLLRLITF